MGALTLPTYGVLKFGVVQGPSEVITLGSAQPKLNFSVTVTPACAANMEVEVLVACETRECGLPLLVGHVCIRCGLTLLQILLVLVATNHADVVADGSWGTFGVVLPTTYICRTSDCWALAID